MNVSLSSLKRALLEQKKVQLDNLMAEVLMGWQLNADDPRRLWRDPGGTPIRWLIEEQHFNLCAHPWRNGINQDDDRSFDPLFNYHRKRIDWWQVVVDKVAADRRADAQLGAIVTRENMAEIRAKMQRRTKSLEASETNTKAGSALS